MVVDCRGNTVDLDQLEAQRLKFEARHWLRAAGFSLIGAKVKARELNRHGSQEDLLNEIDVQHASYLRRQVKKQGRVK